MKGHPAVCMLRDHNTETLFPNTETNGEPTLCVCVDAVEISIKNGFRSSLFFQHNKKVPTQNRPIS